MAGPALGLDVLQRVAPHAFVALVCRVEGTWMRLVEPHEGADLAPLTYSPVAHETLDAQIFQILAFEPSRSGLASRSDH
jgi:hypothetical protein